MSSASRPAVEGAVAARAAAAGSGGSSGGGSTGSGRPEPVGSSPRGSPPRAHLAPRLLNEPEGAMGVGWGDLNLTCVSHFFLSLSLSFSLSLSLSGSVRSVGLCRSNGSEPPCGAGGAAVARRGRQSRGASATASAGIAEHGHGCLARAWQFAEHGSARSMDPLTAFAAAGVGPGSRNGWSKIVQGPSFRNGLCET